MCFVEFKKVFDWILYDKVRMAMIETRDVTSSWPADNTMQETTCWVEVAGTLSEWYRVRRGIDLGPSHLFNVLAKMLARGLWEWWHLHLASQLTNNRKSRSRNWLMSSFQRVTPPGGKIWVFAVMGLQEVGITDEAYNSFRLLGSNGEPRNVYL